MGPHGIVLGTKFFLIIFFRRDLKATHQHRIYLLFGSFSGLTCCTSSSLGQN